MKNYCKNYLLFILIFIVSLSLWSKPKFFVHNRYGALIKIDVASAFEKKLPRIKGPNFEDIKEEYLIDEFDNRLLTTITEENDKKIILSFYEKNSDNSKYILKVKKIFEKKIEFGIEVNRVSNTKELEPLRIILMKYNKDNEMLTGLDEHGTPMPHNFSRVFEAKTKANFDIHIAWGVKFDNFKNVNNDDIGAITLDFGIMLSNFSMPSLEILVKYNFILQNYPFFEPYVGGLIYGGFIDGFPIGISAVGGMDFFPLYYENIAQNKDLDLSVELRMGTVLFCPVYFDSGLNTEGIWKKFKWLAEAGIFAGFGYLGNSF
jgi:hypothetical protein